MSVTKEWKEDSAIEDVAHVGSTGCVLCMCAVYHLLLGTVSQEKKQR